MKGTVRRQRRQAGQAMVEYLLLLLIVLLIALGLLYQFNDAFRIFASNLFGNYVACLLETGELPGLGAPGNVGICGQEYGRPFNRNEGQQLADMGSGGGGGGGGSGGQGGQTGGRGARERQGSGGSGTTGNGSSDGRSAGSSGGGGAGSGGRFGNRRGQPARTQVGKVAGGEGESESDGSGIQQFRKGRTVGQIEKDGGRVTRMVLDRRFMSEQEKEEAIRGPAQEAAASVSEKARMRPKRMRVEPIVRKSRDVEIEGGDFSLGIMLRYFLIAAILLVILVLLGGQALQISKSWEK